MGVPGDMNLELLDYIDEVDGLTWGKLRLSFRDSNHTCRAATDQWGTEQWEMPTS